LAGFFSNHLSHRYGLQQTFSFCCLDNQFSIRLDLFQILISPISLVCSSLTDTGGSGCRCNISRECFLWCSKWSFFFFLGDNSE
jgi:hypothetical protein